MKGTGLLEVIDRLGHTIATLEDRVALLEEEKALLLSRLARTVPAEDPEPANRSGVPR